MQELIQKWREMREYNKKIMIANEKSPMYIGITDKLRADIYGYMEDVEVIDIKIGWFGRKKYKIVFDKHYWDFWETKTMWIAGDKLYSN